MYGSPVHRGGLFRTGEAEPGPEPRLVLAQRAGLAGLQPAGRETAWLALLCNKDAGSRVNPVSNGMVNVEEPREGAGPM